MVWNNDVNLRALSGDAFDLKFGAAIIHNQQAFSDVFQPDARAAPDVCRPPIVPADSIIFDRQPQTAVLVFGDNAETPAFALR